MRRARRDDIGKIQGRVRRDRAFWRNLIAVATWELVWGFGAAFVASPVVTALALQLTSSKAAIGLLGLMQVAAVPSLLLSAWFNRRVGVGQRRMVVAAIHVVQVAHWAGVGLVLLAMPIGNLEMLVLLVAVHAMIYFLSGLLTAPTYELLSDSFGRRYGSVAGVQLFVNRGAGMVGGVLVQGLLAAGAFPLNFGQVLLIGGSCLVISNVAVLAMVEGPRTVPSHQPLLPYLAGLGRVVRGHREFLVFLGVNALMSFITVVQGFATTFALERLHLPVAQAGLFTALIFVATGLGGLTGPFGDRFGHQRLLVASLLVHAAALGAILASETVGVAWFYAGLTLVGLATAGCAIATNNMMVDFAPPGEKGAYSSVGRLATLAAAAAFTPAGGWLIDATGYGPTLAAGVALALGCALVAGRVGDPRQRGHGPAA